MPPRKKSETRPRPATRTPAKLAPTDPLVQPPRKGKGGAAKYKSARIDEEGRRFCAAKRRSREGHCGQRAIPGGTVCRYHGGAAPQVKAAAESRLQDLLDPTRAWREVAAIAYFDPAAVHDPAGRLLPIQAWPPEARAALASFEVLKKNITAGDGIMDDVLKVRMWDKIKALEMILKRLGELQEKLEHAGEISFKWQGE